MAESLVISGTTKEERYRSLLPQLVALTDGENDLIANLSNITGALRQAFGFFWTGVYFVKGDQLVLGPFQGPVACTRISRGRGVCGTCWEKKQAILVPDVDQFPGHIACSSDSKSEIVVPVFGDDGEVILVLDIDSDKLNDFDATDRQYLEEVAGLISVLHNRRDA
ncbi:MAG TPA: GAF domain-containing protein [Bacteroidia bacterium]|nr:GAF domain-containing protein [Bacteroidia bacterium]